jgi:hypothetical protein
VQIGGEGTSNCSAACDWVTGDEGGAKNLLRREILKRRLQRRPPDDAELHTGPMQRRDLSVPMRKSLLLERLRFGTMDTCHGYVDAVQNLLAHAA